MTTRRNVLAGISASLATTALPLRLAANTRENALSMPPLLDATGTGRFRLQGQEGGTNFLGQSETPTWGFNQPYLGPTVRVASSGAVQAEVVNNLDEAFALHWHGLLVPGEVDGGPHQAIAAGQTWTPELPINQPAATVWYHAHTHGNTARQVHKGLAGVMQLSDGLDDERGLPSTYGLDDLTLVLQDRIFDRRGRMNYDPSMHDQMMGFTGDTMLVNGQVGATAVVPSGIVRLRLLNGSNSRIYSLSMSDGRPLHLVATDNGLLNSPFVLEELTLAPGERYEVLLDFGNGADVSLLSAQVVNEEGMGGGMMGGGMMGGRASSGPPFEVLPFAVDTGLSARITSLPGELGGARPSLSVDQATRREITLDMSMGPMMMMRRSAERFSINGNAFDMRRINFSVEQGSYEVWSISGDMMMHPFHVHGVSFQVLSENGRAAKPQNQGWKDTLLVDGQAEILMQFNQAASADLPYMFHCHILEHEDGGMMGQFAVV